LKTAFTSTKIGLDALEPLFFYLPHLVLFTITPNMDSQELNEIYAFAVQLGKDAGDMLMAAAQRRIDGHGASSTTVSYVEKENSVDLVTKTDNGIVSSYYLIFPCSIADCYKMLRTSFTQPSPVNTPIMGKPANISTLSHITTDAW
jgi:hypothetical protein